MQLNSSFNGEKVVVQIVNLLGQTLSETNVYPRLNTISVNTNKLTKGTSFLKIIVKSKINTSKFIIQ